MRFIHKNQYLAIALSFLTLSCTPAKPEDRPNPKSTTSSNSEPKPEPNDGITPPVPVTGAFLYCEVVTGSDAKAVDAVIGCVIKSGSKGENVDVAGTLKNVIWSYEGTLPGILVVATETPADSKYHQTFMVQSTDGQPIGDRDNNLQFEVKAVSVMNGGALETKATTTQGVVSWMKTDFKTIPAHAIEAGSEQKHTVLQYICRMNIGNTLIAIGRFIKLPTGDAICYSFTENRLYQSDKPLTGTVPYPTEVLILTGGKFEELLEWVDAAGTATIPLALTAGKSSGIPVQSCRALDDSLTADQPAKRGTNDPAGEYQPGMMRPAFGCNYNFYNNVKATKYQVLGWKSKELMDLMDPRL